MKNIISQSTKGNYFSQKRQQKFANKVIRYRMLSLNYALGESDTRAHSTYACVFIFVCRWIWLWSNQESRSSSCLMSIEERGGFSRRHIIMCILLLCELTWFWMKEFCVVVTFGLCLPSVSSKVNHLYSEVANKRENERKIYNQQGKNERAMKEKRAGSCCSASSSSSS